MTRSAPMPSARSANGHPVHAFGEGIYPPPPTAPVQASAADVPKPPERTRPLIHVKLFGSLSGCRVELETDVQIGQLRSLIAAVRDKGFVPESPPLRFDLTADGSPICPKHRVAMKKREKQGDTWWNHQVTAPDGQVLYCRGHCGPESPGYEC